MDIKQQIWQQDYMPVTDFEAGQLLKLLSEEKKEISRLVKNVKEEIEQLEQIGKEAEDKFERLNNRVNSILKQYVMEEVDEEDRKETKTQYKYKLARGEVIVTKPKTKMLKPSKKDEGVLIERYKNHVTMQPKFEWGDFKKQLEIGADGKVYNKTNGELVDNIPVMEEEQSVKIKLDI